jgi:hypothetical protein
MSHARRIVMFNWVTADGYFAGPDGNLDWVVPDEEQAKAAAESIPNFDTVLFGVGRTNSWRDSGGTLSSTPPARFRIPTILDGDRRTMVRSRSR